MNPLVDVEYPYNSLDEFPDVFIYLHHKDQIAAYARIPAKNFILEKVKGPPAGEKPKKGSGAGGRTKSHMQ